MKLGLVIAACLAVGGSAFAAVVSDVEVVGSIERIEKDAPESITSLGQIEQIARNTQKQFWQLIPPVDDPLYIHPDRIVRAVGWDSKEWPDAVLKQMVAEMGTAGLSRSMYPFYRITVVETRAGEMVYYNSFDQEVWRTPAPLNYNPYLFAFQQYGVESEKELTAQQKIFGRSSNIGMEILLLPEVFMEAYEEDVALEAQALEMVAPMAMMSAPPASTNLMLAIGVESNEVEVGVFFPAGYTNPVSVFQCTSLTEWDWSLLTNMATTGLSSYEWSPDIGPGTRFWVAARSDVDSDGEGLMDCDEKYLYKTSVSLWDSDFDGLSDFFEIQNDLDPLYGDSNTNGIGDFAEANLATSVATHGSGGVLVVVPQTGWYHAIDPSLNLVYLGE